MSAIPFETEKDVENALSDIRRHMISGGVIAYPTETVYGLGSTTSSASLNRLGKITKRPSNKPFLLLVSGRAMMDEFGFLLNATAAKLADSFWPGPLTMVLECRNEAFPAELRGPGGGIAVRWTSHSRTARMIDFLGEPITSTSANASGGVPPNKIDSVLTEFSGAVDSGELLVLDGGDLEESHSSTIIDCTSNAVVIVREGAISRSRIEARVTGASR